MNFADRLVADCDPSSPALITAQAEHSHGELAEAAGAVARFLLRSGGRPGDCVGIMADNSIFWAAAYLGVMRAGCVAVPVSPDLPLHDCRALAQATQMRTAFVESRRAESCARWLSPGVQQVVLDEPHTAHFEGASIWSFGELLAPRAPAPLAVGGGDDLAALLFSSGSTGKPRAVMLSHGNLIANTESIIQAIGLTPDDRAMAVLPFHYSFGASVLQTHLALGASVVIDRRFVLPDQVLQRAIDTGCTGFAGVPSHYQILLRRSRFKEMRFPRLRWLQQAGGRLQESLVRELREAHPELKLYLMYGATEATARLSILPPEEVDRRPGSIGRGIPGVLLRVLDEEGRPVAPGEIGEIVAEGRNIARGYFQDPEASATTFRAGRLHTGDLATMDAEGYLSVAGRAKSFLKIGGQRTSAERFEEALLAFPDIVEAAVVAVPDELLGEAPAAFVVARDARDATVGQRLREFARSRLPLQLQPKLIEVVPELPKNAAGKLQRMELQKRLRAA